MTSILYTDVVATLVSRLRSFVSERSEPYLSGLLISHSIVPTGDRTATLGFAGGPGDTDTVDGGYLALDVLCSAATDAADITRLFRAVLTGRGQSSVNNGRPITRTTVIIGPEQLPNPDGRVHLRTVFEVRHRGEALI